MSTNKQNNPEKILITTNGKGKEAKSKAKLSSIEPTSFF